MSRLSPGEPGGTMIRPVLVVVWYGSSPSRQDGGASPGLLPQAGSGVPARVKSSRPPRETNDSGSHGRLLVCPLTFRACTYGASVAACGARIVIDRLS